VKILDKRQSSKMTSLHNPDFVLQNIASLLFDATTSDFTFVVQGEKIPVHRCILGSASGALRAVLFSSQEPLVLEQVSPSTFKDFVKYLYTGSCELWEGNAQELHELAKTYELSTLEEICEPFYRESKTVIVEPLTPKIVAPRFNLEKRAEGTVVEVVAGNGV
jgi:BTB/POZ domain-containing protein 9